VLGDNSCGQSLAPSGTSSMSAQENAGPAPSEPAESHLLGQASLPTDETADPPSDAFVQISSGGGMQGYAYVCACGLRSDGNLACWGDCGGTSTESQMFTQVSVGAQPYACSTSTAPVVLGAEARQLCEKVDSRLWTTGIE